MVLQEKYALEKIRNESAELVYERIEALLEDTGDFCGCEICVLDLAAFVLNRITPKYSTSLLGNLHPLQAKIKKQQVELDLAIQAGLKRLREHPHHG